MNSSQATNISIDEPGLHWHCSLNRNDRQCFIHCFGVKGYAISFRINDIANARGRTRLENELISSVVNWLQGKNINEMRDDFQFIDPGKRALEIFRDQAIEIYPELERCVNIVLEPYFSDSFCLWFATSQRICKIKFSDQSQFPTCEFYWEDFNIFKFSMTNNLETALILKRWFCDNAMPSDLAQEFSWLDTGKLSQLYDFGKVIEAEFIRSWDEIEQFYKRLPELNLQPPIDTSNIFKLINQMRQNGFDKTFRAGQSLTSLVLSRSRHNGLRNDQSCLLFQFDTDNLKVVSEYGAEIKLHTPKIEFTTEIERLLKELETHDID